MEDWDLDLFDVDYEDESELGAIPAAQMAAATPVTQAILDLCSRDMDLPFTASPKAMARLLDIAILTGHQKAAVKLSKKCEVRPLRRWARTWAFAACWEAARTALWAGANLQNLMVNDGFDREDVPFSQALFLKSKLEDWQKIRHLLPKCHDRWSPSFDNLLGSFFLESPHGPDDGKKLSVGKIHAAEDAGLDLQFCFVWVREDLQDYDEGGEFVMLLDIAIWCGQPDCAKACVDGGMELEGGEMSLAWHKRVLRGDSLRLQSFGGLDVAPSEAQIAAAAAGRASLKRLWKSESSQKGIVLYQMMLKMSKRSSFPMALVQEILTFSMPVPNIIDQLDLREHVGDWMATIGGRPTSEHLVADCNTANVEKPQRVQHSGEAENNGEAEGNGGEDNGEAGALLYIEVLVLFFIVCF